MAAVGFMCMYDLAYNSVKLPVLLDCLYNIEIAKTLLLELLYNIGVNVKHGDSSRTGIIVMNAP